MQPRCEPSPAQGLAEAARLAESRMNAALHPAEAVDAPEAGSAAGGSQAVRARVRLQEEALLEWLPGGVCAVREFSETDIYDAIEVRGTLDGLAARLAAERGAPAVALAVANDCLARIDDLNVRPACRLPRPTWWAAPACGCAIRSSSHKAGTVP